MTPSLPGRESERGGVTIGCRELTDVEARLADMDRLGIETQVIYPTLFLIYLTDDVNLEIALRKAYNRWLTALPHTRTERRKKTTGAGKRGR
jgi:hypothetical protein